MREYEGHAQSRTPSLRSFKATVCEHANDATQRNEIPHRLHGHSSQDQTIACSLTPRHANEATPISKKMKNQNKDKSSRNLRASNERIGMSNNLVYTLKQRKEREKKTTTHPSSHRGKRRLAVFLLLALARAKFVRWKFAFLLCGRSGLSSSGFLTFGATCDVPMASFSLSLSLAR